MRSHLLNETTADLYRRAVTEGVERIAAKLATTERPHTGISVDELAPVINGIDLDRPLEDPAAVLDELEEVYLRDAVYFHHPRYLGHLNCPVVIPAVLGEAVLSAVNSSLDTWDQSIGGTLIERRLIDWTAQRIGLGPDADGIFTSGGSQSNFHALLLARDEACRKVMQSSERALPKSDVLPRLRIFTSEASHFSVKKSAAMLGLGYEAVIAVPVDRHRRMDTSVLALELENCAAEGLFPMAVVATAGTTDFGSIDPLPEIARLAAEHSAWMHVDAAYGCGLLISPPAGTCSTASSWPTRSRSTTTSRSSSRSVPARCWSATATPWGTPRTTRTTSTPAAWRRSGSRTRSTSPSRPRAASTRSSSG